MIPLENLNRTLLNTHRAGKTSKFMGDADRASVDDEVMYSYDVHNNGTTTMSDIQIVDSMVRASRGIHP